MFSTVRWSCIGRVTLNARNFRDLRVSMAGTDLYWTSPNGRRYLKLAEGRDHFTLLFRRVRIIGGISRIGTATRSPNWTQPSTFFALHLSSKY